ncbi:hypothetical protein G7074_07105 [Pedobacter sp. HDW13]|uniref:hypothetical protein n=1 Tax=unclassified Pedobacter TaxID=2628915 RepID=UPI000F59DD2F|nr:MULTISPECIES: hypothetical protein [unclassified Pedobacter]QIL39071.1 hypothetical protein G7074_07105 [Pedobacter sp. HDW13]
MKLDFIENLSDSGKFKQVVSENIVRLYDFDETQTAKLINLIKVLVTNGLDIEITKYVKSVNCKLILKLSSIDNGVLKTSEASTFICELTTASYLEAIDLMINVSTGYNWLCKTSKDNIDFLYSADGNW